MNSDSNNNHKNYFKATNRYPRRPMSTNDLGTANLNVKILNETNPPYKIAKNQLC